MSLISISGKIGSGKDTVADIIQYLIFNDMASYEETKYPDLKAFQKNPNQNLSWEVKRFADEIKDTVCRWIGCTREELEDREFKETPLGEEWAVWKIHYDSGKVEIFSSEDERDQAHAHLQEINYDRWEDSRISHEILTPRRLMQLLGTDAGRNIIHPNLWVNTRFSSYEPKERRFRKGSHDSRCQDCNERMSGVARRQPWCKECSEKEIYPNWIIPDTRFPNEIEGIEEYYGIKIRIERKTELRLPNLWEAYQASPFEEWERFLKHIDKYDKVYHYSETALDQYDNWDYVIYNNYSIEKLIESVKEILEDEGIL